jgi:hypothetical protein
MPADLAASFGFRTCEKRGQRIQPKEAKAIFAKTALQRPFAFLDYFGREPAATGGLE